MADNALDRIVAPVLDGMGYELVRVAMTGGTGRKLLQVMAERKDREGMTVDDCADISRALSPVLDVEDPIRDAYVLEVSSPGLDRPLMKPADYVRFQGFEAKVEMQVPHEGRKRFQGRITAVEGENTVTIDYEGTPLTLPFAGIAKAKLVLTDDLIAAATRKEAV